MAFAEFRVIVFRSLIVRRSKRTRSEAEEMFLLYLVEFDE